MRAPWPSRRRDEQALSHAEGRLAQAPEDIGACLDRAQALDRLGRDAEAREAFLAVLRLDMRHTAALGGLADLLARCGFTSAARTVLGEAVAAHPENPALRASLGHLLRAAGDAVAARAQYAAALRAEPDHPEAHQGLSYLCDGIDEAACARHRELGFARRALSSRAYRGEGTPVVVLKLVSARGGNVPTRHLLDDRMFLTHTLVVEYAAGIAGLPPHDVVFNAIGDAERCMDALVMAERLLEGRDTPVINAPADVRPKTRAANARTLGALPGVIAPRVLMAKRTGLAAGPPAGFDYPFLLRTPGFHTGENFLRVDGPADLSASLDALPGETLAVIEPLDARSDDGFFRKYRMMMVGGMLLPLHLAVSRHWKVHHFTAEMDARPEHRREEAAFLADTRVVLGERTMAALGRIADALGLDYGGIDFARAAGGEVLLFEANATMAVVPPPAGAMWDYRRAAATTIIKQLEALVMRKSGAFRTVSRGEP